MEITAALWTVLAAMTPVGELRVAIPWAMSHFGLPWYQALGWSLVGNLAPVPLLLWGLRLVGGFLMGFANPLGRVLAWRKARLHAHQGRWFRRYGSLALVPLVAIPLPFTGAWTGCLAAWVFEIPPRKALPLIALGVLIAGIIVTTLTQLGISLPVLLEGAGE